jgi:hypothetical protein
MDTTQENATRQNKTQGTQAFELRRAAATSPSAFVPENAFGPAFCA